MHFAELVEGLVIFFSFGWFSFETPCLQKNYLWHIYKSLTTVFSVKLHIAYGLLLQITVSIPDHSPFYGLFCLIYGLIRILSQVLRWGIEDVVSKSLNISLLKVRKCAAID